MRRMTSSWILVVVVMMMMIGIVLYRCVMYHAVRKRRTAVKQVLPIYRRSVLQHIPVVIVNGSKIADRKWQPLIRHLAMMIR